MRLSAKIETSVKLLMMVNTKNVPSTVTAPTSRGRPAATNPPNTMIKSSKVMGRAIVSARVRSFSIVSPTCRNTSASPVTVTAIGVFEPTDDGRLKRGDKSSMRRRMSSSDPVIRASTSA